MPNDMLVNGGEINTDGTTTFTAGIICVFKQNVRRVLITERRTSSYNDCAYNTLVYNGSTRILYSPAVIIKQSVGVKSNEDDPVIFKQIVNLRSISIAGNNVILKQIVRYKKNDSNDVIVRQWVE